VGEGAPAPRRARGPGLSLLAVVELGRGPLPVDAPVLHADDEGVLRARAVFETLRVYGGRPFRLDDHLDRFAMSAARVGLRLPPRDAFADAAAEAIASADASEATLRLLWTAGREGAEQSLGLALVSTLPAELEAERVRGLQLATVVWTPGALAGAKSTSYAENLAARNDAWRRGADDALLVSVDGVVLEAPTANVWWREGETLVTPSLELPILAGVTRAVLIELASNAVEEGTFPLEWLLRADEAFLTSSVREVMPVVAVDGAPVGDGRPGPAAAALQRALRGAGYPLER
jgi:branched-subunit amino acid aminotransferase/4-amino-4-deoxychorismate lyase